MTLLRWIIRLGLSLMPLLYWEILACCVVILRIIRFIHKRWYNPNCQVRAGTNLSGRSLVEKLLSENSLSDVTCGFSIRNEYVYSQRRINFRAEVANSDSITATALAAHEFGHAKQHASKSLLGAAGRIATFPLAWCLRSIPWLFAGSLFSRTSLRVLLWTMSAAVIFAGIIFLAECEASILGYVGLKELGILTKEELGKCRKVLVACGATYLGDVADVPLCQWHSARNLVRNIIGI